ncbi:MAG: hypothetical protein ACE15D_15140 [Candidatus Eisenbacteria bacterium]|nr:hypothetical protein [Candidatus Eisenbacteria bacterium]
MIRSLLRSVTLLAVLHGALLMTGRPAIAGGLGLAVNPRYSLECSADTYALGDSVLFRWTNNTDSSLVASYQPPFDIHDMATGELVYAGELPTEYWLGPHQYVDLVWDQRDWFGNLVPPGDYRVSIWFTFNGNPPPPSDEVEDFFEILAPTPVDPARPARSWGRLRGSYR